MPPYIPGLAQSSGESFFAAELPPTKAGAKHRKAPLSLRVRGRIRNACLIPLSLLAFSCAASGPLSFPPDAARLPDSAVALYFGEADLEQPDIAGKTVIKKAKIWTVNIDGIATGLSTPLRLKPGRYSALARWRIEAYDDDFLWTRSGNRGGGDTTLIEFEVEAGTTYELHGSFRLLTSDKVKVSLGIRERQSEVPTER
jgi:hypothetical protein